MNDLVLKHTWGHAHIYGKKTHIIDTTALWQIVELLMKGRNHFVIFKKMLTQNAEMDLWNKQHSLVLKKKKKSIGMQLL